MTPHGINASQLRAVPDAPRASILRAMSTDDGRARSRRALRIALPLVLAYWALLAIATPVGAGPDEPGHIAYGGFLLRHGRLPVPERDSVLQAQHPPLYYAFLALAGALRPDALAPVVHEAAGDVDRGREILRERMTHPPDLVVLPGPYRVELAPSRPVEDHFVAFHPIAGLAEGETIGPPAYTTEGFVLLLRLTGALFMTLVVLCVFAAARAAESPLEGAAAAAAVVLVPQFAADFAFVNSDQFAILFSSAAFALLAWPGGRPLTESRRPLWAGMLLGLALLSKLFAAGACVACGVFVLLAEDAPLRRRLRALAMMALPAAALGLPWVFRQFAFGSGIDPVVTSGVKAPLAMKPYAPDLGRLIDFCGDLGRLWFSSVGGRLLGPGALLELLAAAFPLLAVAGACVVARDRRLPRLQRAFAASFLAGLAVQLFAVAAANVRFHSPQGRYLHALDVPGTLALAAGARALCGPRARAVLWWLAGVAIASSFVVGFLRVLPAERPRADRFTDPDLVFYVDPGAGTTAAGPGRRVRDAFIPRPEDDVIVEPREVATSLPPLTPGRPYAVRVKSRRVGRPGEFFTAWLNDARLGGPFTPEVSDDWVRFGVVAPSGTDRAEGVKLRLRAPFDAWTPAVAEAQVLRVPFDPPTLERDGAALIAVVRSSAPARLLPLAVSLEGGGDAGVPLKFDGDGVARARFASPPPAGGASVPRVAVLVAEPPTVVADFKMLLLDGPAGSRNEKGFLAAPSFIALEAPETKASRVVATLYQYDRALPEGVFDAFVLDETGAPVRPGLLAWRMGVEVQDASVARLTIPRGLADGARVAELVQQGPKVAFDRLVLKAPIVYRFDVEDPRR
jgi:hypothetical protein